MQTLIDSIAIEAGASLSSKEAWHGASKLSIVIKPDVRGALVAHPTLEVPVNAHDLL